MIKRHNILHLQHALYEISSGERMLDYFLQESAYLKTRLSQVTDDTVDPADIVMAEYFQTLFVQNDLYMNEVRNDMVQFKRSIQHTLTGKKEYQLRNDDHYRRLTTDVIHFEKHFYQLKREFNFFVKKFMDKFGE